MRASRLVSAAPAFVFYFSQSWDAFGAALVLWGAWQWAAR